MAGRIQLEHGIVAILNAKGEICGTGFFVNQRLIATCAHVVVDGGSGPGETLTVYFRQSGKTRSAKGLPEFWRPRKVGSEDVAILELDGDPPEDTQVLPLGSFSNKPQPFVSQGFPALGDYVGITSSGIIESRVQKADGRWMLQLTSQQIEGGFSGAPVWNLTTQRVVGMISEIWTPKANWRNRDTAFATLSETLRDICPALQLSDICPYRSLNAFKEEDAAFFFGRDRVVNRLLDSLHREPRFLAVMGPSGSGKSSVVQAGLIPELRNGKVPGSDRWAIIVTRPANVLFEQLKAGRENTFSEGLQGYREWLKSITAEKHLLIIVDQFEELLVEEYDSTIQGYLNLLVELLETHPNITMLLVIRDDFYGRLSSRVPQLLLWIERSLVNIPADLESSDLIDIIQAPAREVGMQLEEGLVETILDNALEVAHTGSPKRLGRSTVLPLLEFALTQIWERRQDGWLTHNAYRAIGGVTGSLIQWAEQAYYTLEGPLRPIARYVMTSLVHLGDEKRGLPDSRRSRTLSSLIGSGRDRETIQQVVQHLTGADHRPLTTRQDPQTKEEVIEIIHEALIREWGRLRGWLEEDRRFLFWRQEIERRVAAWVESEPQNTDSRDKGKLLRGGDLVVAVEWLEKRANDLYENERAFLEASHAEETRQEAERQAVQKRELEQAQALLKEEEARRIAEEQRVRADRRALSQQLASQSRAQIRIQRRIYPQRSLLLALEALRITARENEPPTPAAEGALREALANTGGYGLSGHKDLIRDMAVNRNNTWIATGSEDNTVQLWRLTPRGVGTRPIRLVGHRGKIWAVAFSPNDRWLVTCSDDRTARLWDLKGLEPGANCMILEGHDAQVMTAAFSEDSHWLVTGGRDNIPHLWDLTATNPSSQPFIIKELQGSVRSVAFSKDNHWLVISSLDGAARVWDLTNGFPSGPPIVLNGHIGGVTSMAIHSDSRRLITSAYDGTIRVWNLAEDPSENPIPLIGYKGPIYQMLISSDDRWLITAGNRQIYIWDLTSDNWTEKTVILDAQSMIRALAISPNNRSLFAGGTDGMVRVWDLTTKSPAILPVEELKGHDDEIFAMAISSDGLWLVTGSRDATARLWDLNNMRNPTTHPIDLKRSEGWTVTMSFDGRRLITTGVDGSTIYNMWDLTLENPAVQPIFLKGHKGYVSRAIFSRDHRWLVTCSEDGATHLWDMNLHDSSLEFVVVEEYDEPVVDAAISRNSRWLVTCSRGNGEAHLRDLAAEDPTSQCYKLTGHKYLTNPVAFSPDNHWLVTTSSGDYTAHIWDLTRKDPSISAIVLRGHRHDIKRLTFSPDHRFIITASRDGTARLWDLTADDPAIDPTVLTINDGEGFLSDALMDITPYNHWLITLGVDWNEQDGIYYARIWNLAAEDPSTQPMLLRSGAESASNFRISPDGHWLLTISIDRRSAHLWSLTSKNPFEEPVGHIFEEYGISSFAFSPDSMRLVTSSINNIGFWDLSSERPLEEPVMFSTNQFNIKVLGVSSDNHWLITQYVKGVSLWNLRLNKLVDLACRVAGRNLTEAEWNQHLYWKGPYDPTYKTCPQWQ